MHAWEFYDDTTTHAATFAAETRAAMRQLGVAGDRLALDRIGTPGYLALQRAGVVLADSAPVNRHIHSRIAICRDERLPVSRSSSRFE